MASCEQYYETDLTVDLFQRFLEESNDTADLLLFLFARSLGRRQLRKIVPYDEENEFLPYADCFQLTRDVFGPEQQEVADKFNHLVRECLDPPREKIMLSFLLYEMVRIYHHARYPNQKHVRQMAKKMNRFKFFSGGSLQAKQEGLEKDDLGDYDDGFYYI